MFGLPGGGGGIPFQLARGAMGGGGPFGQQPMGMGRMRGGAGMSMGGQMMNAAPMFGGGGASPTMGALGAGMAGMALSDSASKTRIRELESELERTYAALGGGPSTSAPPASADAANLDAAYRRPTSNSYEYKDPSMPGAAPGRQAGPMADELKGIPGVVRPGPDGFDRVDTPRLTMNNTSQIGNNTRDIDALRRDMDALLGRVNSGQSNPDGTY